MAEKKSLKYWTTHDFRESLETESTKGSRSENKTMTAQYRMNQEVERPPASSGRTFPISLKQRLSRRRGRSRTFENVDLLYFHPSPAGEFLSDKSVIPRQHLIWAIASRRCPGEKKIILIDFSYFR